MLIEKKPVIALILVGIVATAILLLKVFTGTAVAPYILPIAVLLCLASAWLFARKKFSLENDLGAVAPCSGAKSLAKGFLTLLAGVGWAAAIAVAVRIGIVPSDEKLILWAISPTFVLIVVGAVYLVRGFSSDIDI